MKRVLIFVFVTLFLAGCACKSTPSLYLKSTAPIFITNEDVNKSQRSVFIHFKNSSGHHNTLEQTIRAKFLQNGFKDSVTKDGADIIIMGDFVSLQKLQRRNSPRTFINMGYGWGRGYRGQSLGVGMVFGGWIYDNYGGDYYL